MLLARSRIQRMPWHHRISFIYFDRQVYRCDVWGIHLVVRFFRRVWEWSLFYRPSVLERAFDEIHDGYQREIGYKKENERLRKEVDKLSQKVEAYYEVSEL